ncbi:TonB-dependent siderophore receptor [Marinomonas sp.]
MKRVLPFHPTLLAVAIASVTSYSYAADTQSADVLETIEVTGQTYRNTATKTQLDSEETPQAITIITNEELEEKGVSNVAEALRYASGVNTELRGGAVTRFDLFNIRGFDNDTVLLDGLPLVFNEWNLQLQIDVAAIEQIEIFKGPTSTLYGEMPPGGMVNIITKGPQSANKTALEVILGSDNKKEVSLDTTGAINDDVNYRVIAKVTQSDGQAATSENERILLAPSVDIKLSEDTLLNLNMYYQNDPSAGIYSALPSKGTVFANSNGQLSSDTYLGDVNWDTYEREVLLLGYKLDHKINKNWSFLQNTRFTFGDAYQENVYAYSLGTDEETVSRSAYITDESVEAFNIDNQLSAFYDVGNTEHNILLGVDYLNSSESAVYKYGSVGTVNLFNPDNNQVDRNALLASLTSDTDFTTDREQLGLYVQDQIRYEDWVFLAGLRYDQYEIDQEGVSASYGINDLKQSALTGRVGALYKFDSGISPFINFAQSFEPEIGQDTDGNAFETSTANQVEAGIKYENRSISSSATAFHIVKSNVVMNDPESSAYDKIQVGEVTSQGIELEVKKAISNELNLSLAYTYQDVEITQDSTNGVEGNTPVWTPEQQFSSWLNYQPNQGALLGTSFGVGIRYVGETQIDAENSATVPSYTLTDLSVGYDLAQLSKQWQGASVQFAVSNVFDKEYYSCYDTDNCWFGADRSFELKGRYEF